jgi:hypothetical protein
VLDKEGWCERGDSNPHPLRDQILSLARLPIPPLSLAIQPSFHCITYFSGFVQPSGASWRQTIVLASFKKPPPAPAKHRWRQARPVDGAPMLLSALLLRNTDGGDDRKAPPTGLLALPRSDHHQAGVHQAWTNRDVAEPSRVGNRFRSVLPFDFFVSVLSSLFC